MSATQSNMPRGTRQAALIALCLAACLLAWRGTALLTERPAPSGSVSETTDLTPLLEPVLGTGNFRLGGHTGEDGTRHVLILVDTARAGDRLGSETRTRIETILAAATGFDPASDQLQIQPLAFAPGTTGALERRDLIELGALAAICALLAYLSLVPGRREPAAHPVPAAQPDRPREDVPQLRAVPVEPDPTPSDDHGKAQRLARENPQETARILRGWMSEGSSK